MNTLFAMYLWLMQILGIPGGFPVGPGLTVDDTQRHSPLPPPDDDGSEAEIGGQQDARQFISNGF